MSKEIIDLLEPILKISWAAIPLDTSRGYIFEIHADDRDLIVGSVTKALTLLKQQPTAGESQDKIGSVCDDCGKHIDTSSEGIVTESGELLCMECQSKEKGIEPLQ